MSRASALISSALSAAPVSVVKKGFPVPDAKMTTLSARGGLGGEWGQGTTGRYFEQLDEAWADFRIEVVHYRELGQCVVALGVARGAGKSSHIEVASDFAVVFVVMDSQILLLDTYDDWKTGLEAAGLRDQTELT